MILGIGFGGLITVIFSILVVSRRRAIEGLSVLGALILFLTGLWIAMRVAMSGTYEFFIFSVDPIGAVVLLLIGFLGLAAMVYSVPYLRIETQKEIVAFSQVKLFFCLMSIFLLAMACAVTAACPIFSWIFLEATSLSTAFLIGFYNKASTLEAAWKYLIINAVGLLIGFFGTMLFFTTVPDSAGSGFVTWQWLIQHAHAMTPMIAKVAFVFVLFGYGTKAGLAPMHTWLPDAHGKAPAPLSALLSGVLLNVALVIILRFKLVTDAAIGDSFSQTLFLVLGVLSILIAAFIIVIQVNYKRAIAYSSIENMGLILLGFAFGGMGAFFAILHVMYNALIKATLFFTAGTFVLKYSTAKIAKISGGFSALPVTSILLFGGFLAITGVPPFGVFFTKVYILATGFQHYPWVCLVALMGMTILFVGFLRHIAAMVFGEVGAEIKRGDMSIWLVIPPAVLMVTMLGLSVTQPAFLSTLLHQIGDVYQ